MKLNIKKLVIYLFAISITSGLSIAQQEPNDAITIKAMPKATKGFPVVIKVTIQGPLNAPYISIVDHSIGQCIPVVVYLTSESDGKEYVIESNITIQELDMSTSDGLMFGRIIKPPTISIPNGQKYTMLFDLWSMLPEFWPDTCLSDVPAGKYRIYMTFNPKNLKLYSAYRIFDPESQQILENLKSNSVDIELSEPTPQEKQFFQKVQEMGRINHKNGVDWFKVLSNMINIPSNDISLLEKVSRDQLSFHKLISDVNIADEKLRNKSIADVNNAILPEYFEPERQLLLLELKGNPEKDRLELLKKYPQLRGMAEKLNSGNAIFLGFKEMALQMKKNKELSAIIQNIDSQNQPNNNTNQRSLRNPRIPAEGRNSVK